MAARKLSLSFFHKPLRLKGKPNIQSPFKNVEDIVIEDESEKESIIPPSCPFRHSGAQLKPYSESKHDYIV